MDPSAQWNASMVGVCPSGELQQTQRWIEFGCPSKGGYRSIADQRPALSIQLCAGELCPDAVLTVRILSGIYLYLLIIHLIFIICIVLLRPCC